MTAMNISPELKTRRYNEDVIRLAKWVSVLIFLRSFPAVCIFVMGKLISVVSMEGSAGASAAHEFASDQPLMLVAFYGGFLGAGSAFIASYFTSAIKEPPIETIARFALGGFIGLAAFLLVKNNVLIKIMYPKFDNAADTLRADTYHPTMLLAFVGGLIAPNIVNRVQGSKLDKDEKLEP